ncbi:hypothetical protein GS444_20385 [Rhodococcus hoagii]|nr:hypothetical protein [Prescottella equi]
MHLPRGADRHPEHRKDAAVVVLGHVRLQQPPGGGAVDVGRRCHPQRPVHGDRQVCAPGLVERDATHRVRGDRGARLRKHLGPHEGPGGHPEITPPASVPA